MLKQPHRPVDLFRAKSRRPMPKVSPSLEMRAPRVINRPDGAAATAYAVKPRCCIDLYMYVTWRKTRVVSTADIE